MTQALRVEVPGPAYWTLTVDGAACPVDEWVPVPPGRRHVELRCAVPGRVDGRISCAVDVPAGAEVVLSAPYDPQWSQPPSPSGTATTPPCTALII